MVYSLGHLTQCQSPSVKYACCHRAELQQNSKNVVETVEDQLINREGNGNPHQYDCLENPRDGGAW